MITSRVAVVTGGANGIGEAISRRLAADGIAVAIADLDLPRSQSLASEIQKAGGAALGIEVDVASPASIDSFLNRVQEELGPCSILVNNAGIAGTVPLPELSVDDWNKMLSVNVTGALLMSKAIVPSMQKSGWGRIVNMSSITGYRASAGRIAYGTTKAAILGLTRQLAVELALDGIAVNAVAPGPIETPLTAQLHTPTAREGFMRNVPMRRYGTPADVAGAVSFLCSDDAAYVTGTVLPVDGGFLAAGVLER